MASVSIDVSEVRAVAADMRHVPASLVRHIRPVLSKGALNIKTQLQEEARSSTHFKGMASGITYDLHDFAGFGGGEMYAEIGPVKHTPGSLGNIAYFGTSRGGGTVPAPEGALHAEAARFEQALGDLTERLLL